MEARLVFAGTPGFAAVHLQALLERGAVPAAVYTQPDRRAGRGQHLQPSPVRQLAETHGLEVRTPPDFADPREVERLAALRPQLLLAVAYGVLLPPAVLAICPCVNVHASLLPELRGAAPIARALLEGRTQTGITLMRMTERLDAGDMLLQETCPISADDTAESLAQRLAGIGAQLLAGHLEDLLCGRLHGVPQDESRASYARKLSKREAPLDFTRTPAELERQVRGLIPWPVATISAGGQSFKVFRARARTEEHDLAPGTLAALTAGHLAVACRGGMLEIELLQPPGRGPVRAGQYARGRPDVFSIGGVLGG